MKRANQRNLDVQGRAIGLERTRNASRDIAVKAIFPPASLAESPGKHRGILRLFGGTCSAVALCLWRQKQRCLGRPVDFPHLPSARCVCLDRLRVLDADFLLKATPGHTTPKSALPYALCRARPAHH